MTTSNSAHSAHSTALSAFLSTIAYSELPRNYTLDQQYRCLVGSTPTNPKLFDSFSDHPRQRIWLSKLGIYSTAAGRYQILARFYDHYKRQLKLPDFSPASQDAIAIQLIRECKALPAIESGNIARAIQLCSSRWASFPGAGYGQHENTLQQLLDYHSKCLK